MPPKPVEQPAGAPDPRKEQEALESTIAKHVSKSQTELADAMNTRFATMEAHVAEQIKGVSEQLLGAVEKIAAAPAPAAVVEAPAPELPAELVTPIDNGLVRFMSPTKNYRIVMERGEITFHNGRPYQTPQKTLEFQNGIYDATEEEAEFLRGARDKSVMGNPLLIDNEYFEDPTAKPQPGPTVVTGPRSTGASPRAGVKPEASLAAPL